jgi:hypothetical protein
MGRGRVLMSRLLPGKKMTIAVWYACHTAHGGVIVSPTEDRGERDSLRGKDPVEREFYQRTQ